MYDLMNFIEELSSYKNLEEAEVVLKGPANSYHIGRISIVADKDNETIEFIFTDSYEKNPLISYSRNGYSYNVYSNRDNYAHSSIEKEEILKFVKLIAIHHYVIHIVRYAENAKNLSLNTGLPNVNGFIKKIGELGNNIKLTDYNSYFINIKSFGLVNSIFGLEGGNNGIRLYSKKLSEFMQKDEIVAHLGGDNFLALIKKERHNKFIDLVTMCSIELIKDGIKKKVNLIGIVGYYEIENDSINYEDIIAKSSMACRYARNNKKIVVKLTPEIAEMLISAKNIEHTFRDELEKGNFIVYYQPKFDIKSGKIIGVEALSRWNNNGKIVPPGLFVPVLEKNGEIINLDLNVLDNLCRDIHNYRNMGHRIVPASCNLSRRDFEDPNLEQKVIDIIKRYNVKTEDIVIEVTETTNLEEKDRLAKFIAVMTENGIMTSIDDFGTGYSSLSVLRDFKVNEIKIDRSFINRSVFTDSDEIIIGSIIDMAKRLNLSVICEGVETEKQAEFLINLGCNNAQGYLYSRPLPKLEFEALMQKIGTVWD